MIITSDSFESYLTCRYKLYLKFLGKDGIKTDYVNLQCELRKEFQARGKDTIITKYKVCDYKKTDLIIFSDLVNGRDAILNTQLMYSDFCVDFDALVKVPGDSALGSFHYMPILFCRNNKIYKNHKILIGFQAYVIGTVQKRTPQYAQIIYGQKQRTARLTVDTQLQNVHKTIQAIREQQKGNTAPQLILNPNCERCEYKDLCKNIAIEEDNLSLLSGIGEREIKRQNKKGIFTLTQYSYTFRPRKRNKRVRNKRIAHYSALKALAIRENKIYIYGKLEMPSRSLAIFMDVEGNPEQGFDYLIGLLLIQ